MAEQAEPLVDAPAELPVDEADASEEEVEEVEEVEEPEELEIDSDDDCYV